jgi:hypothetical protein
MANGKIKKKYNIVDERKDLEECLNTWTSALDGKVSPKHKYNHQTHRNEL